MALKSCSVIHVFQWFCSVDRAVCLFCSWPNVHSSTMALLPVLSKRDGVIQGCWGKRRVKMIITNIKI